MKIFTVAHVPEDLVQTWLQHLRDFDMAHPGCKFEVMVDAPDHSIPEMIEMVRINPDLTFHEIIARKRG